MTRTMCAKKAAASGAAAFFASGCVASAAEDILYYVQKLAGSELQSSTLCRKSDYLRGVRRNIGDEPQPLGASAGDGKRQDAKRDVAAQFRCVELLFDAAIQVHEDHLLFLNLAIRNKQETYRKTM